MKKLLALICAAAVTTGAYAQDDEDDEFDFNTESSVSFSVGTDLASGFVWRGLTLADGANFQPWIEFSAGPFTAGLWNCTSFDGEFKEFDMYMSATAGQVKFTITDYYTICDYGVPASYMPKFTEYHAHETGHSLEFSTDWESEFGLDASFNVIFYGADKRDWEEDPDDAMKNAYSTYFEVGYTATVKKVDFRPFVGATFGKTTWYGDCSGEHGANVVNVGVKASHELKITDHFSLPIYAVFGYNPQSEDVAAFAGFSIGF